MTLALQAREYQQGLNQQKQATSSWGKGVDDIVKNVQVAFAAAMAAMLVAAVAFISSSLGEFRQFEIGMTEVFTLLPSLSEDAMGAMEDDVLAFGREVGRTSDETIPALYQSISAGVPASNVFDFMKVASDAALGGVTDLETAVDGISSAVNAYGSEVLGAQQASDLMFTAVKGGKTTFEELSGSLFNVIPTAASMGVEFGNITAALAAMTAQGTPTSVATTQLRQLLIELSQAGGEASGTFERMAGQTFVDFIASGGNLQDALQLMEQAAADSGLRLSDMFGSVEAGAAALTLTGAGTEKFAAELDAAAQSAGATGEAAAKMGETGQQAINELNAAFEGLKITIGEQLAPTVTSFTQKATEQLDLMTSTTRFNEMVGSLRDMGFSVGEVNDIVGDGRAQFDLWRTAADMEDDMNRNAEGMRRMELAIQGVNLGLEDQRTVFTGAGGAYRITTNDLSEFVDLMEQFTGDLPPVATGMEYWALATQNATTAIEESVVAVETQTEAMSLQEQQLALVASGEREMTFTTQAAITAGQLAAEAHQAQTESAERYAEMLGEVTARMADYFVAATNATGAVGFFNTTTTEAGAVLVDTEVSQASLNQAMYDAAVAAGASATELAVLGVATGVLSAEQAEAALKTAILQAGVAELAAAYVAGDLSISGLRTEMALLVADVNNMDVEIGASTGEVDIYAGSISTAGAAAVTAAEQIGGLRTAAEDAAGNYAIHFDITQSGSIPNPNGGYAGSSGAGNVAPEDGYALGGFTGYGPASEIAGFVHRGEYVLPPDVTSALGLPFLEMLRSRGKFDPAELATDRANYTAGRMQPVTNNTTRQSVFNLTTNARDERARDVVIGSFRRLERMDKIRK